METKSAPNNEQEIMADVFKHLPPDALEVDLKYAFFTTFRVWITVVIAYYVLYNSPWYLLPLAWIFAGTAATGLFVVGHDCAHQSFSKSTVLNEIVGTICMMPLVFPYNAWDLTHSYHHTHANNLDKDHLWRPFTKEQVSKMSELMKFVNYYMYGPLFFESSIFHHAYQFFFPFTSKKKKKKLLLREVSFLL